MPLVQGILNLSQKHYVTLPKGHIVPAHGAGAGEGRWESHTYDHRDSSRSLSWLLVRACRRAQNDIAKL